MSRGKSDLEDARELREVLRTIGDEVPKMLKDILGPLASFLRSYYSPDEAKRRGQALGVMYKELINEGIPEDEAIEMIKSQIVDLREIFGSLSKLLTVT